jgi:hypothetical protein
VATQAKERQIRKPADSVPENLPEQTKETRDAVAAEIGVSGTRPAILSIPLNLL